MGKFTEDRFYIIALLFLNYRKSGIMNPKSLKHLQSGQALLEYWPAIPAAIAVMIGASIIVGFINTTFLKTANGLEGYCKPEAVVETKAELYNHTIEASARVYDSVTNRTTIAYTVTSGDQPAISHWILGVPKGVADHVISTSEAWSWIEVDPTTGAKGMKFDIGYSPTSGGSTSGGTSGGNGNGGGPKKGTVKGYRFDLLSVLAVGGTETRVISITLDGNYDFGSVTVTTKSGATQIGTDTISGPIAQVQDSGSQNNSNSSGVDRSKGC